MNQEALAQQAERFLIQTASGVLCMSFAYLAGVLGYVLTADIQPLLDGVKTGLSLLAMVIVLPGFIRLARLRMLEKAHDCDADSYTGSVFQRACVNAFSAMFIALILSEPASKILPEALPLDFYRGSFLVIGLSVLSISFFVTLWRDRQDDDSEELEN